MASRKLQVRAFVESFLATHCDSPSYGEIARALGIGRTSAQRIVRRLVRDGVFVRADGDRRGIRLPNEREDAIARLRAAGFVVDEDVQRVTLPGTKCVLPRVPELADSAWDVADDGGTCGGSDDSIQSGRGQGHARDRRARTSQGAGRAPRRARGNR